MEYFLQFLEFQGLSLRFLILFYQLKKSLQIPNICIDFALLLHSNNVFMIFEINFDSTRIFSEYCQICKRASNTMFSIAAKRWRWELLLLWSNTLSAPSLDRYWKNLSILPPGGKDKVKISQNHLMVIYWTKS